MAIVNTEQVRARRRASVWTTIHPIFAIGQLLAFVVSVVLLALYFRGAVTFEVVHESVLFKIALMLGAVVTGALWEKDVYGYYWFAPAFLFEDTVTVIVLLLHGGYLAMAYTHTDNLVSVIGMLLFAYTVYAANVAQYVWRTHQHNRQTAAVQVRAE